MAGECIAVNFKCMHERIKVEDDGVEMKIISLTHLHPLNSVSYLPSFKQ